MADKIREPRKKWRSGQRVGHPYPVLVQSVTGIPAHLAVWKTFVGRFNGDSVFVHEAEDIAGLYNMGFFGKGSLSRSCPRYARKSLHPEIIRERQWKQRSEWEKESSTEPHHSSPEVASSSVDLQLNDTNQTSNNTKCSGTNNGVSCTLLKENESTCEGQPRGLSEEARVATNELDKDSFVIVIADTISHSEDFLPQLNPRLEKNPVSSREVLTLSLEEAVFLNYGLGCLLVKDILGERELSSVELWTQSQEACPRFLERYITYHYFRSKNWVVKSGLKFGGDFLLYKDGPGIYHASYIVLARLINEQDDGWVTDNFIKWTSLMGLNRLAEASGKEVLLCYVLWPSDVVYGQLPSPNVISKFKVHEVIVRRWQSSVARVSVDSGSKKNSSFNE